VTKITIEGIRGVTIDHILKLLMELQIVRIVGRSDLPGRPFLYGTTQTFLEQFGLRSLDELGDLEPMLRREMIEAEKGEQTHDAGPTQAAD
jgi:segregation and condensation protein B